MDNEDNEAIVSTVVRDEWEIRQDYDAVTRAIAVVRDKNRFKDVQNMSKAKRLEKEQKEESDKYIEDGDIKKALGL
jgi:hypothetical protein